MLEEDIIKEIHDSDLKGTFVEIGAGMPVSNALFNTHGASKTIVKALCPYDKEIQDEEYGWTLDSGSKTRSVSYDMVKAICFVEARKLKMEEKGNFVYASTFQLGDDICNHGWIGIFYKGEYYFYHITLSANLTRYENIEYIGEQGILILEGLISGHIHVPAETDMVFDEENSLRRELMFPENGDYITVFNPQGQVERLEESFRGAKGLIVYKGSFNPLHEGHKEILSISKLSYSDYQAALCISVTNFDKGVVARDDLFKRIRSLNKEGHYVFITCSPTFILNGMDLKDRLDCDIVFPMGIDTYTRLTEPEIKMFNDLELTGVVFSRNNVGVDKMPNDYFIAINHNRYQDLSSTKIRKEGGNTGFTESNSSANS